MDDFRYSNQFLKAAVNELCLLCEKYKDEHNGACNDCRWYKEKQKWNE